MITKPLGGPLAACLLALAACGSSSGPTTPSTPPSGGGTSSTACRNLATSTQTVSTGTGFSSTVLQTCTFNAATRQGSCTGTYTDSFGTTSSISTVSTYASLADVVDEIVVIPPLQKALTSTGTQVSSATGTTTGSVTNTFDAAGRIVRTDNTSASGNSTTTYSAWDAAGRPTTARDVGQGFDNTRQIRYDDTARTRTTTVNGGVVTTVETFDANGNPTAQTAAGGGSSTSTVITTLATTRICK